MVEYVISYKTKKGCYRSLELEIMLEDEAKESDELAALMTRVISELRKDPEYREVVSVEKLD